MGLGDLFSWLTDLLEDIWDLLEEIWPIILLAVMIYFAPTLLPLLQQAGTWLATTFQGWSIGEMLSLGFGALSVIDPSSAKNIVGNVSEVAGEVGEGIGEVASGTLGSFFSSGFGAWVAAGAAAYVGYKLFIEDNGSGGSRRASESGESDALEGEYTTVQRTQREPGGA